MKDEMDLVGMVIRPPSEADSILLQVTLGCSHGKCAFCGAYREKRFAIKPESTVFEDIDWAAAYCLRQRRVFLCDGDALILPQQRLLAILDRIRERLPWVTRVGSYANAKSLKRKTDAELAELVAHGLGLVYLGLESGDDKTLAAMGKHGDVALHVAQGRRAMAAGMKLSVSVVLGLAGPEGAEEHARLTGEALSAMDPDQAAALSLMLIPGTPLHDRWEAGLFTPPTQEQSLRELRALIAATNLSRGLFLSDHASNYLPLRIRLPRDKEEALTRIDAALAGQEALRPEWQRRL
jgi:radical SAM superfamily enzyme YgiQ (UPF0313 family)